MKKLMVFLMGLGLGLIFITGSFENSLAEEKDLLFQRYTLSSDSSKIQSFQERAKNNSAYLKPGPLKPEKVAGEFLLGGFGALACGVGAVSMIPDQGAWPDPGIVAAGVCLYLIGSNLGCATGVYLIGNSGGETGSYLSTLGGSYAGTLVGGMIAFPLLVALGEDNEQWSLVALTAVQSWGATLGFNGSRKKKPEASLEALLNLNDGEVAFSFPQVDVSQDSFSSGEYKVNLFQAKF